VAAAAEPGAVIRGLAEMLNPNKVKADGPLAGRGDFL
jgi:hypothetical protein